MSYKMLRKKKKKNKIVKKNEYHFQRKVLYMSISCSEALSWTKIFNPAQQGNIDLENKKSKPDPFMSHATL